MLKGEEFSHVLKLSKMHVDRIKAENIQTMRFTTVAETTPMKWWLQSDGYEWVVILWLHIYNSGMNILFISASVEDVSHAYSIW